MLILSKGSKLILIERRIDFSKKGSQVGKFTLMTVDIQTSRNMYLFRNFVCRSKVKKLNLAITMVARVKFSKYFQKISSEDFSKATSRVQERDLGPLLEKWRKSDWYCTTAGNLSNIKPQNFELPRETWCSIYLEYRRRRRRMTEILKI